MKIFVYGSLKSGYWNDYLLEDSEFIANGVIKNHVLYDAGFPVMFPKNGYTVYGEIYEIDDNTLRELDRLESNGVMYDRKILTIETKNGKISASTYIGNPSYWDFEYMELISKSKKHNWKG